MTLISRKGRKVLTSVLSFIVNSYICIFIYYNSQFKKIEENNNTTRKIRDLYQKTQEIKGKIKSRLEMLNDQQESTLQDLEKIQER